MQLNLREEKLEIVPFDFYYTEFTYSSKANDFYVKYTNLLCNEKALMNYLPKKNQNRNKLLGTAIAVSLFTAIVFSTIILISYQYYQKQKAVQLQSELNFVIENIRKILSNSNLAAFSVGLTINTDQDTVSNFDYVAEEIMNNHPYLFGVQILEKGEIKYVYPYSVHQSVLGYDILKNSNTKIEAEKAINNKKIYYAGPLDFRQEGKGIVGRLPIFYEGKFWGFSAVLIKIDDFLEAAGINNTHVDGINILFSKKNPNTGKEEFFTSNEAEGTLTLDYIFAESGWKLTAYYKQDPAVYVLLAVTIFLAISSSVGSGLYTYQILKKPEKLESLLSEKTKEIEENNEYLTSMVAAIPDLIFIYDKDARYLDFHAYQDSLLFYNPKDFIGKSIFHLFDKDFAKATYEAIQRAISTAEIVHHSYYLDFKEGRKYFESRFKSINSEKVLAVVREVTETKLSAKRLQKSEQKYRNLVSQASDAIFLSDEKGNLQELNQKGLELTGIAVEELEKYNLLDIIKFENEQQKPFLDVLLAKGHIFEEVSLKSLRGREITAEINCKVTPERQIHGIIRDVTARNKIFKSIQSQNERLKEIAWIQSHEVRAPLARLLGLIDYLEKYDGISQTEKFNIIDSIRGSALELDAIIRDVVNKTELAEITPSKDEYIQ